jgi:hypothetical protein
VREWRHIGIQSDALDYPLSEMLAGVLLFFFAEIK